MPQIDLMQIDLPHTLYKPIKRGKQKKKGVDDKYRVNPRDKALALQEEANRMAEKRRKAKAEGKIPYTKEELFTR